MRRTLSPMARTLHGEFWGSPVAISTRRPRARPDELEFALAAWRPNVRPSCRIPERHCCLACVLERLVPCGKWPIGTALTIHPPSAIGLDDHKPARLHMYVFPPPEGRNPRPLWKVPPASHGGSNGGSGATVPARRGGFARAGPIFFGTFAVMRGQAASGCLDLSRWPPLLSLTFVNRHASRPQDQPGPGGVGFAWPAASQDVLLRLGSLVGPDGVSLRMDQAWAFARGKVSVNSVPSALVCASP